MKKSLIQIVRVLLAVFLLVNAAACGRKAPEKAAPQKKILYRSTMMPNEISDKPGKDSMGMEMVPFEARPRRRRPGCPGWRRSPSPREPASAWA